MGKLSWYLVVVVLAVACAEPPKPPKLQSSAGSPLYYLSVHLVGPPGCYNMSLQPFLALPDLYVIARVSPRSECESPATEINGAIQFTLGGPFALPSYLVVGPAGIAPAEGENASLYHFVSESEAKAKVAGGRDLSERVRR